MTITATSSEAMLSRFIHRQIDRISGDPDFHSIRSVCQKLAENANTLRNPTTDAGWTGLVVSPNIYNLYSNRPFNRPADPGEAPNYGDVAISATERARILAEYEANKSHFMNMETMEANLIAQLLGAFDPTYFETLLVGPTGYGQRTLHEYIDCLIRFYGHLTPRDHEDNHNNMRKPYDPSTPITTIFTQIQKGQEIASHDNMQFNIPQLVTVGEGLIINCGAYKDEFKSWRQIPLLARTWTAFKLHFTAAYALRHEMLRSTTASSHGYANNAEEVDDEGIVRDFAAANAADRAAFEQLSQTNAGMTQHIAAQATLHATELQNMRTQLDSMNQQFMMFSMGQVKPPQPSPTPTAPPAYHAPPAGNPYQVPPTQPYQQQPYQQQQPPFQQQYQYQAQAGGRGRGRGKMRGGGGRGGRGGRGGGRGAAGQFGGYAPAPTQQFAPFGGYQQGGYQSGGQQSGQIPGGGYGGYQPPQSFSNTKKRFNNMNYCWTHGGDVHHEHTSAMCGNPDEGHQWYATRDNMLGGATKNMHKVWQG